MAGLKDRIVTVQFPELTEEGEPVLYVSFRNPALVPMDWLRSNLATGADGRPLDPDAATQESYERLARFITGLRMYDAEDLSDNQAMLEMPMTAEKVARMPMVVNDRLADEFASHAKGPTRTPVSPTS